MGPTVVVMTEIVLLHHIQGLTPGVTAFADRLRAAGHTVHTPDVFEGRTFESVKEGQAFAREVGFDEVRGRAVQAAAHLPAAVVYAGFSFGVVPAQQLLQTRPVRWVGCSPTLSPTRRGSGRGRRGCRCRSTRWTPTRSSSTRPTSTRPVRSSMPTRTHSCSSTPATDTCSPPGIPRDREVRPSLDEALALRLEGSGQVRDHLATLTAEQLASHTEAVEGVGWPPPQSFPVKECLDTFISEEWSHRQYAERDLTALENRHQEES